MTICSKTLKAVEERLEERKSLYEIGSELCDAVDDPRGKALRLVRKLKEDKAEEYLIENADWLGYNTSKIRDSTQNICDAQKNLCTDLSRNKADLRNKAAVSDTSHISVTETIKPIEQETIDKEEETQKEAFEKEQLIEDIKLIKDPKTEIDIQPQIDEMLPKIKPIEDIKSTEIDIQPQIDDIPKVAGWTTESETIKKDIEDIKKDIEDIENKETSCEINCRMGKSVPDCNICELGNYDIKYNKWSCDDYSLLCNATACRFENNRTCKECGFESDLKRIYWAHVKLLHPDNEILIKEIKEEIRQFIIEQKMDYITIRPFKYNCTVCGGMIETELGFDIKNNTFLVKEELDNIRSFQSAPLNIKEIVNILDLKKI